MDEVLSRLKTLEAEMEALKKASAQSALDKRLGRAADRATARAGRITVTVPLNVFADDADTTAAHASTHLAAGGDPIFTTQAYTPANDSTLRALDVTTLTAVDADVQKVANVLVTIIRDLAVYKVPTV